MRKRDIGLYWRKEKTDMWTLYDQLIEGIPEDITVYDYCSGSSWTYVESSLHQTGVARTVRVHGRKSRHMVSVTGKTLRETASLVKSWNFIDASIGAAALNAWYNSVEKVESVGGFTGHDLENKTMKERTKKDAFIAFADEVHDKKVICVGHFPNIEKKFSQICDLSILERDPRGDDYPDSACEYILPQQDYVFITGMTLTNKTLPRLLQLASKRAKVSIVGPSVPCAPLLAEYGVNNISGFCVTDADILKDRVKRGGKMDIFAGGRMISLDI